MSNARVSLPLWLRWMPRRLLSRTLGFLGRRRWGPLGQVFLRWYCKRYGANTDEAARPLREYRTFQDFFTRELRAGARPMPPDRTVITSPADGRTYTTGTLDDGTLLQAKGVPYPLAALLGSAEDAAPLQGGTYHVIYLAPGDYHRFHWPFDGTAHRVRHIAGDLWPVNDRAVQGVPNLFVRNERVVVLGKTRASTPFAFVPVGALNVGSIGLSFHPVRTNRAFDRGNVRTWEVAVDGARGDPFGWFGFGSSIVLVLGPGRQSLTPIARDTVLRVGQPIGKSS